METDEQGEEGVTPPSTDVNVMLMNVLSSMQKSMNETNKLLSNLNRPKLLDHTSSSFEILPVSNEQTHQLHRKHQHQLHRKH